MFQETLGLCALLFLLYASLGWGRVVLGSVRLEFTSPAQRFAMSALVGLALVAYCLLILGLLGLFYPPLLWTPLVIGGVLAWKQGIYPFRYKNRTGQGPRWKDLDLYTKVLVTIGTIILTASFARLVIPPTTADELSYHLYLPKIFLLKHAVFYWPYHVNSAFPLVSELLYSYGITLSSVLAIKGIHFLFGVLILVAVYGMAREHFPGIQPLWPAVLFLAIPIANHQMILANNDLALTAFLTGAYWALLEWAATKEKQWLGVAGILTGFAMGVKYLALFAVAVQLLVILTESVRSRSGLRRTTSSLFLFGACVLVTGSLWYARSYFHTGNPFYPYLTSWFGARGLESPLHLAEKGFGKDWKSLFLLPWHATFDPQVFGGLSNQWGPMFLGFLPWSLFAKPRGQAWRNTWLVAGFSFLIWFYSKQNLRFLLPALPFFCLIVVATFQGLRERGSSARWVSSCFFLFFVSLYLAIVIFQLRGEYRAILGLERREEYLLRKVGSYDVARFLNEREKGKGFKILSQEQRAYYFDGEVVREKAYRSLSKYEVTYPGRVKEFYESLLKEGFTHLLMVKAEGLEEIALLNELVRLGKEKGEGPQLILSRSFQDSESKEVRTYLLYEFSPPGKGFTG